MQSKINNDNNTFELKHNIRGVEELLLNNKEILNSLILENTQKKDKSFISIKEVEIIKEFESNLLEILGNCPPQVLRSLLEETSVIENESGNLKSENTNKDTTEDK